MRKAKIAGVVLLIILVGIQFIPASYNTGNNQNESSDFLRLFNAPDEIAALLKTSCYDCHSNNTKYPWYSRLQPGALFMEYHIRNAKNELNFHEFRNYSVRKKKSKLKSMLRQIEKDEMPLVSYRLLHPDARLSPQDKIKIVNWLDGILDKP